MAAVRVLPSSVPDSGTAGRLGLAELLLHPQMIPPALATRAVYNRPVLGAINRAYGNGPSVGAQQLADLFRTLGRNAPAPLVASRQGSGK